MTYRLGQKVGFGPDDIRVVYQIIYNIDGTVLYGIGIPGIWYDEDDLYDVPDLVTVEIERELALRLVNTYVASGKDEKEFQAAIKESLGR
jgi:hypothetical protein